MARCVRCKRDVGCGCGLKEGGLCSECRKKKREEEAAAKAALAKENEQPK